MILTAILLATLAAGIGSVWLAALLGFGLLARYTQHMLSMAAGALLATSFMLLLPEAFESQADLHALSWTLLAGIVGFFLLEKSAVLRHSHHHEGDGHGHHHGHDRREAGPGGAVHLAHLGLSIEVDALYARSADFGGPGPEAPAPPETPTLIADRLP
jgi:zinc and cadmium transporter